MKRIFDLALAIFGLILLSPVFLVVALLVAITDGFPILFRQTRVGKGARPFEILKFRTMRRANEGAAITVAGDNRITSIGRILRATKLDELPQLWNVVKGQMSFVGPRPEVPRYVELYSPEERQVLQLKPGITDLASFAFFDESELLAKAADPEAFYRQVVIPEKIRLNLAYAEKANPLLDLFLIVATVLRALKLKMDLFAWLKVRPPDQTRSASQ
ncbi:MAG: sugar transferase [Bdellovibrionales bacterium]